MATLNVNLSAIKRLYQKNSLSAREIAKRYKVSIGAVYYCLKRAGIERRNAGEQNRLRFENEKPSFNIKKDLDKRQQKLFVAGVMLYWGEGSQWAGETTVDFANCKPEMIKVFVNFLNEICQVKKDRLRVYLYCFTNQSTANLISFWEKVTGIPKTQFTRPYIRKSKNLFKIHKMPYGLIHVRYSDKKLLLLLRKWITILPQKLIKYRR